MQCRTCSKDHFAAGAADSGDMWHLDTGTLLPDDQLCSMIVSLVTQPHAPTLGLGLEVHGL